jgi:hypothetical protein
VHEQKEHAQIYRGVQQPDRKKTGGLPRYPVTVQQSAQQFHDSPHSMPSAPATGGPAGFVC